MHRGLAGRRFWRFRIGKGRSLSILFDQFGGRHAQGAGQAQQHQEGGIAQSPLDADSVNTAQRFLFVPDDEAALTISVLRYGVADRGEKRSQDGD
jgi:hypothetical protein